MASATSAHRDRASGQASMFDDFAAPAPKTEARKSQTQQNWTPWTNAEKLAFEKELLGFYVTGHPLNPYRSVLLSGRYVQLAQLGTLEDRTDFRAAGSITEVSKKFGKKDGTPFAIIRLEDLSGSIESIIWGDLFAKSAKLMEVGQIVAIQGRVDLRGEELKIKVNEVTPLRMPKPSTNPVRLRFDLEKMRPDELGELRDILAASPGECPVEFEFHRADGHRLLMQAGPTHRVALTPALEAQLQGGWSHGSKARHERPFLPRPALPGRTRCLHHPTSKDEGRSRDG